MARIMVRHKVCFDKLSKTHKFKMLESLNWLVLYCSRECRYLFIFFFYIICQYNCMYFWNHQVALCLFKFSKTIISYWATSCILFLPQLYQRVHIQFWWSKSQTFPCYIKPKTEIERDHLTICPKQTVWSSSILGWRNSCMVNSLTSFILKKMGQCYSRWHTFFRWSTLRRKANFWSCLYAADCSLIPEDFCIYISTVAFGSMQKWTFSGALGPYSSVLVLV